MRARDADATRDDEERDPRNPDLLRDRFVPARRVGVAIAGEHLFDLLLVETGIDREARECGVVTDRCAFAEVAAHQPLLDGCLLAALEREMEDAMRVTRRVLVPPQ